MTLWRTQSTISWVVAPGVKILATPMPSSCSPGCAGSACVPPAAPPPPGAVGAYEGGMYSNCNIYRPLPRCYMRDNSAFCPVCAGVIRRTLQPFMPV